MIIKLSTLLIKNLNDYYFLKNKFYLEINTQLKIMLEKRRLDNYLKILYLNIQ